MKPFARIVGECCQCGSVASTSVANFQLRIGIGIGIGYFHIGNILQVFETVGAEHRAAPDRLPRILDFKTSRILGRRETRDEVGEGQGAAAA